MNNVLLYFKLTNITKSRPIQPGLLFNVYYSDFFATNLGHFIKYANFLMWCKLSSLKSNIETKNYKTNFDRIDRMYPVLQMVAIQIWLKV
jgi:hypothetical protein